MRHLDDDAWVQFKRHGRVPVCFNGDEFETLVRILLKEFPGTWEATPRTRDGGKDVVDRSILSDIAWAECKMYRAPISLQVVSNTLVMAIIESNVRRIFLFSYSDITDNAKHYLARYGSLTGKKVQVYDGDLLEVLILRSSEVMTRYFPRYVEGARAYEQTELQLLVTPYFSLDVHVRQHQLAHVEGAAKSREYHVPLHTPCLYELVLVARHVHGVQTIQLALDLEAFADFEILNAEQVEGYRQLTLDAGQTVSLPFYLAPKVSGALLIPSISLQGDTVVPVRLPPVPMRVSAFERPLLVGKFMREALAELDTLVSSGNINRICVISGRSGVGKSRFIDESMTHLLKSGYEIHYFDGTYVQSISGGRPETARYALSAQLIRSLLCSLWRLPDPASLSDHPPSDMPGEAVLIGEFGPLSEMVYAWDAERLLTERLAVVDMIVKGYCSRRNAIIIDNVQTYPEAVIGLLDNVVQRIAGIPGQSFLLLAFNEDDLVFNAAAAMWSRTLNAKHGDIIRWKNLPEFSRTAAVEFINNLFEEKDDQGAYSETHPETLNLILEKILPRPLDLWQFAKGLEDRDAIRVGRSAFTIIDFAEFNRALQELHPERERLLNWRLTRLCATADLDVALAAITYLGPLSLHELQNLSIDDAVSRLLIQASVLRENREQKLEFYHPSLTRHFIKHSKGNSLLTAQAKQQLHERASKVPEHIGHGARWFGLAYDVGAELAPYVAACAADFIDQDGAGASPLHLPAERLLSYVQAQQNLTHWWPLLQSLAGAAHIAAQGATAMLPTRTAYLYQMANRIAPVCPPERDALPHWTHIIREMAGYVAVSEQTSEQADKVLCKALISLDECSLADSESALALARSQILNRRCVTLRKLRRHNEAAAAAQASRLIAESHGLMDLVCLNWVDQGYLDYGLAERNTQLCVSWNAACTHFDASNPAMGRHVHDIELIMALIQGNLDNLAGRFEQARGRFDQLLRESRDHAHVYYQLQGMAASATMLLRQAILDPKMTEINCYHALEMARALEDSAGSMQQHRRYRTAFYLQGKAYELMGESTNAIDRYTQALRTEGSFEEAAIKYDLKRLSSGRAGLPPAPSTFSIGNIYMPLP